MIESITFRNILSFRDEVTLSFEATNDKSLEPSHVADMPDGTRLLRVGVILGANASGKSNTLKAIKSVWHFLLHLPQSMDTGTGIEPFLMDRQSASAASEFSMSFWVEGVRYTYHLLATARYVLSESLSYRDADAEIVVFERGFEEGRSTLTFKAQHLSSEELNALSINCLSNMSLFAARGKVNVKLGHVDTVRAWMQRTLLNLIEPHVQMNRYAQQMLAGNEPMKKHLLDFLSLADFNITGLNENVTEEVLPESLREMMLKADEVPQLLKRQLTSQSTIEVRELRFEHTVNTEQGLQTFEMDLEHESSGTQRLIGVEAALYDALHRNGFLMVDELESSLHPDLVEYLLQRFLQENTQAQLLFTSHAYSLLATIDDLLRKDNFWFVEKEKDGGTSLYSLVEFRGTENIAQFASAYRNGQFGAIPQIMN